MLKEKIANTIEKHEGDYCGEMAFGLANQILEVVREEIEKIDEFGMNRGGYRLEKTLSNFKEDIKKLLV